MESHEGRETLASLQDQHKPELRRRMFEDMIVSFVKTYAPQSRRENAEFHRDLHSLIRQVYADAQEPVMKHLEMIIRSLPMRML
jgi:hypothetical protein